jgi:rubrerythrin
MNNELQRQVEKAISKEREAYNAYISLMNKAPNHNVQTLFATIAIQELKHETLLEEYLKTEDIIEARQNVESMYNENFTVTDKLNPSLDTKGLSEGLTLAISKEDEAAENYSRLMEQSNSADLRDLFSTLSDEEKKHALILRKEYRKLFGS